MAGIPMRDAKRGRNKYNIGKFRALDREDKLCAKIGDRKYYSVKDPLEGYTLPPKVTAWRNTGR